MRKRGAKLTNKSVVMKRRRAVVFLTFQPKKVEECISTKSQSNGFQRNDLFRGNVAEIHVGTQKFDEPYLLGLLGCFPDNFLKWYFRKNLLDQS